MVAKLVQGVCRKITFGAVGLVLGKMRDNFGSTVMLIVPLNVEEVTETTFRSAYVEFEHFDYH